MPDGRTIAGWQRRYDRGETCAAIAASAGVDRTTVRHHITTVTHTGPRPGVRPVEAIAAMKATGAIKSAAKMLRAGHMQVRHALWRAGLVNDPVGRGRGDWGWPIGRWDIVERIADRDRLVNAARAGGLTDAQIAEERSMDAAIVAAIENRNC